MDISRLQIGILHSLIGKNDGVSIVIDQSIEAMINHMGIPLGNVHLLAAHSPPRFNTVLDDIFWHKNEQNRYILANYTGTPPRGMEAFILRESGKARRIMAKFVEDNDLDLLIIHNSCHPTNFIYAVAAGMYFESLSRDGRNSPKYLLWWHDSHFERERFRHPNRVIRKFLNYIPGPYANGIVFINSEQAHLSKRYYQEQGKLKNLQTFFRRKTVTIPNTCRIGWDWEKWPVHSRAPVAPPEDQYNKTFFRDIGLLDELKSRGRKLKDTVILLQHTRIVERKRIDHSIDFAFKLEAKFRRMKKDRFIMLLISGHSGDEHDAHLIFLKNYFLLMKKAHPEARKNVGILFAENRILPEREVIVEKKFYRFADIPGIIARAGGLGTYFSEVEGFGNNLLEMISLGLPAVINRYPIYKKDIAPLGFKLPSTENGDISARLVDNCYELLTSLPRRNALVRHNLRVLKEKLHHGIMAERLTGLIHNLFKYS